MIGSIALLAALLATTPPARPRAQAEEPELDLHLHGIEMPDLDFSRLRTELRSLEKLRRLDLSRLRLLAQRDEDEDDEEKDAGTGATERDRRSANVTGRRATRRGKPAKRSAMPAKRSGARARRSGAP